ncbi:MAG: alpha-hydroxy-acid oxidizing protein [Acidimicrobiia bacterium]|nr:alpha-hydroxy-acid oxidizing protein [Acidimicrobiia bacterium]NNJ46275.1 alpha-hydroxy-acid oxidizing protein [Acidimicrobiia bacterium]NNL97854.1 alpha-hydroxy-acid oxidizing protein [Acidimicrobiia bacterium]
MDLVNLFDYEAVARERLDRNAFDYYFHGANDEVTLRENRAAFDRISLRYRVLAGLTDRDHSTSVLGHDISMPVLAAPTAFHKLAHPDGEIAAVSALGAARTAMILSSLSTVAMEDVVAAATGPVFFQLYIYKDRGLTDELVARAEAAGCAGIVLTVDAPVWGRREPDVRNRFSLPDGISIENAAPAGFGGFPEHGEGSGLAEYVASLFDPSIDWDDLEWLAGRTPLPVLIKGVARGDDAVRSLDHGAAAVVVSNHGGRQLDTAPATIDALPEVAAAMDGRGEILLDGGIRRGTDVVKALARGARAVLLGRPILWGLAVDGAAGVTGVLDIMRDELDTAMALCGVSSVGEIDSELL